MKPLAPKPSPIDAMPARLSARRPAVRALLRPLVRLCAVVALALIAGCATPPPAAYEQDNGAGRAANARAVGKNSAGESCTSQPSGAGRVAIYCGTWDQPSAEVRRGPPSDAAQLMALATSGSWRASLTQRFACAAPETTTIAGGHPAVLLPCTRRIGGWPGVALVALVDGTAYYASGVGPALPVMERTIGVLSGAASAAAPGNETRSGAEALVARRLAARAFTSGDVGQYQALMAAGTRANLAEDPAAAALAFRAALALQEKALGPDDPNTVTALTYLALQVSNQGSYAEADRLFARAAALAPKAADPLAGARLLHCEGLDLLNQGKPRAALTDLRRAEAAYAALVPPQLLADTSARSRSRSVSALGGASQIVGSFAAQLTHTTLLVDPITQSALLGVVETRRYQAVALLMLGENAQSAALVRSAEDLARANGVDRPILSARLARTAAATASAEHEPGRAASLLAQSSSAFALSLPRTAPVADTDLLRATALLRENRTGDALGLCRRAFGLLEELKRGTEPDLLAPCLGALATAARAQPAHREALLAEMFEASQLGQDTITSRQIAEASARLAANAKDPKIAAAIRERQDAANTLSNLYRERDLLEVVKTNPGARLLPSPALTAAELDARIKASRARLDESDTALQAVAPNYGELVQQVVSAHAVFAELAPDEAFAEITLDSHGGFVFVLAHGRVAEAAVPEGTAEMAKLVEQLRASIEPTAQNTLPRFDFAAAEKIYADTLGKLSADLAGAHTLVVAPTGPLLAIPFEVLLTGPAHAGDLATAPWLLRRFVINHVPAAANFVSLARIAGTSRASIPWFGFGDFIPVTLAQAEQTFPGATCHDSAALFAGLPTLPGAERELTAARELLGASPKDELLGRNFTVAAVMHAPLENVRVLHFATHAILPAELTCLSEPAIVTSDSPGATSAAGALLTSSDVMQLKLDADVVILSACNTGGAGGKTAGQSLSGLARAFFFAGARSLLITHWSVNDQAAAFLIAETLARFRGGGGIAAALRHAELGMLDNAGKSLPAELAQPFFWAPFAVIGVEYRPPATTARLVAARDVG